MKSKSRSIYQSLLCFQENLCSMNVFDLNYKILIYCGAYLIEFFILYPSFASFKWILLRRIGMNSVECKSVFSNRKSNFYLSSLIAKYGDRQLRIVDGLPRKLSHFAVGFWQMFIFNFFIQDTYIGMIGTLSYQIILLFLYIVSYSSNKIFGLSGILYGSDARIRDGIYGRKNALVVKFSFLNLLPLYFIEYMARDNLANSANLLLFPSFVFLPLTIGDALGEIIGTTWGKQKLRVWGIGEINRKSVLGTTSVFLGSLLPLIWLVAFKGLSLPWWLLCLAVAIATMAIELIAPRGTDNFFIPLGNALVCLVFVNVFAVI